MTRSDSGDSPGFNQQITEVVGAPIGKQVELILHNEAGFQIFSDKNGIHLNNMTFPRSRSGKVGIIDNQTVHQSR